MDKCSRLKSISDCIKHYKDRQRAIRLFKSQQKINEEKSIQFYNWWEQPNDQEWFTQFLLHRGLIKGNNKINFCSVFGDRSILDFVPNPKIFFCGENVKSYCPQYADFYIGEAELSIGMEFFEDENYLRFPLWIRSIIPPSAEKNDIKKICQRLRFPLIENKTKFLSIISRHDSNGLKTQIFNSLVSIGEISCPSLFHHNDDTLFDSFKDNKIDYLKQYYFNACPENTNCYGYVTEKIFESIQAGCIPIYWGSFGEPEKEILNSDAYIYWEKDMDNIEKISLINDLFHNQKLYAEYASQPRINDHTEEFINDTLFSLEVKFKEIINNY